jgi:cytochrome c peroxidase
MRRLGKLVRRNARALSLLVAASALAVSFLALASPGRRAVVSLDALAQPKSLQQTGLPMAAVEGMGSASPEEVALGAKLFFDPRLSVDGTIACSNCHDPKKAFTDGKVTSVGFAGHIGQRNSPTILNSRFNKTQFWDGRVNTLEEQAGQPIVNPSEMGQPSLDAAASRLASIKEYKQAFQDIYGSPPIAANIVHAIASYERTQLAFDSPFDHFIAGDNDAIDDAAKRGWKLFNGRGRCNKCHALDENTPDVFNFTDNDFHNIGIGIIRHNVAALAVTAKKLLNSGDKLAVDRAAIGTDLSALGRFLVTKTDADIGAFKTPSLRNVLVTAPYFHDGSQVTLWDAMDHYNKGAGLNNPYLDDDIRPLALSDSDIDDLVAFLASLTGPAYRALGVEEFARQKALSLTSRPQRDTARAFGPKIPNPMERHQ